MEAAARLIENRNDSGKDDDITEHEKAEDHFIERVHALAESIKVDRERTERAQDKADNARNRAETMWLSMAAILVSAVIVITWQFRAFESQVEAQIDTRFDELREELINQIQTRTDVLQEVIEEIRGLN